MTPAQQKSFFDANGYLVVPRLLDASQLAELRARVDQVLDGTLRPQRPNHSGSLDDFDIQWEPATRNDLTIPRRDRVRVVFHMTHTQEFFWRHAMRPEIVSVVANLLGADLRYYTDQMFVKPARHGSDVPFHQDSGYWPNAEPRLLSCWCALDDSTIENGCVWVLPGSHQRAIPHRHFPDHPTQNMGLLPEDLDTRGEIPLTIPAGGAMFHHSLLVHRSFPNRSDRGRRGLVTIYLPADLNFHREWPFKWGFRRVGEAW